RLVQHRAGRGRAGRTPAPRPLARHGRSRRADPRLRRPRDRDRHRDSGPGRPDALDVGPGRRRRARSGHARDRAFVRQSAKGQRGPGHGGGGRRHGPRRDVRPQARRGPGVAARAGPGLQRPARPAATAAGDARGGTRRSGAAGHARARGASPVRQPLIRLPARARRNPWSRGNAAPGAALLRRDGATSSGKVSTMAPETAITNWLRDAHAMEMQAIQILKNQAQRIETYPDLRGRILEHLEETRAQAELLERCLERLGTTVSPFKDSAAAFVGNLQALGGAFMGDEVVKGAIGSYTFEHLEIAVYRS